MINGLLVTKARLPAFIATLAMMSIARGLANIVTDGRQVVGFPDWFTSLSTVRHFGFLSIRMATVDELVGPAVFLLSAAASFCTGVDLVVDGGFVCW